MRKDIEIRKHLFKILESFYTRNFQLNVKNCLSIRCLI